MQQSNFSPYGHLLKDFVTNSYGKSYNHDSQSRPNESQLK